MSAVRLARERVHAASLLLDEAAGLLGDEDGRDLWDTGWRARFDLRQARQRVRMADQSLAGADDPRLPALTRLKRLRRGAIRGSA